MTEQEIQEARHACDQATIPVVGLAMLVGYSAAHRVCVWNMGVISPVAVSLFLDFAAFRIGHDFRWRFTNIFVTPRK